MKKIKNKKKNFGEITTETFQRKKKKRKVNMQETTIDFVLLKEKEKKRIWSKLLSIDENKIGIWLILETKNDR